MLREVGNKAALASFKNAMAVEKIHHDMYAQALAAVKSGKDLPAGPVYICAVCGNNSLTQRPHCPCWANLKIEGATGKRFCPEVIVVSRCPMRMEAGNSLSNHSCICGL
mgnify:CR=1 FL=1